jgi:nitroreductase
MNNMETMKAIAKRHSTRGFKPEQIPAAALGAILDAGCAAPVGMKAYDSMHLTVVQDRALLEKISAAAVKGSPREGTDIYYGAPAVIIISSRPQPMPGIDYANAGCIAENMLLAATDSGIDSVYVFGTVAGFKNDANLALEAEIPDSYAPVASVALGYAAEAPAEERDLQKRLLSVNIK